MTSVSTAKVAPRTVAILGLGVMGGSLARALAVADPAATRVGWSPDGVEAAAALDAGALDRVTSEAAEAVRVADLVVVSTPLDAAVRLMSVVAGAAPADAVVTDVVSLKAPLERAAREAGLDGRWVGSHPMVGSERSGFGAARADLYKGAPVWIVAPRAAAGAAAMVEALWSGVGAHPERVDAESHDRAMAWCSHVPQLVATALATALADAGVDPASLGPGGRDMTRLAGSSPSMWRSLLVHAPAELPRGLRSVAAEATALADALDAGEIDALVDRMDRTRAWRSGAWN